MNTAFYTEPTEKAVVEEIMQWSAEALEQPSPYFNNLPPCPYARSAWMDNKVSILFKNEPSLQVLYTCISQFDDVFDLAIIVDLNPDENSDAFHEYLDQLNDVISQGMFIDKDIWVMGFHPNDEPSDFVEEVVFERDIDTAYSMIFVQRLSKLQKSADKLDKKGYYDSYDNEYQASDIYEKREKLYRRLKNGDET